jgi:ATP-dependent RNA helicase RhlE
MIANASFATLGLHPLLMSALTELGYQQATPVQQTAIPAILQGRDVVAGRRNRLRQNSCFCFAVITYITYSNDSHSCQRQSSSCLDYCPYTRELAIQIGQAINAYGQYLQPRLKVCTVFGGVSINPQMLALRGGADIVVATTGRLLDLLQHNALKFDTLQTLVLDEADKMLSLGFSEELAQVLAALPKKRQNLLFSATFPPELQQLIASLLHQSC